MAARCNQMCSVTFSTDFCVNVVKKLLKGRNRQDDVFRCGSCNASFETICNLHAHCFKHSESGSYHFDNITGTAYPKYHTTCSFTQFDPADLLIDIDSTVINDRPGKQRETIRKESDVENKRKMSDNTKTQVGKKLKINVQKTNEKQVENTHNMLEELEAISTTLDIDAADCGQKNKFDDHKTDGTEIYNSKTTVDEPTIYNDLPTTIDETSDIKTKENTDASETHTEYSKDLLHFDIDMDIINKDITRLNNDQSVKDSIHESDTMEIESGELPDIETVVLGENSELDSNVESEGNDEESDTDIEEHATSTIDNEPENDMKDNGITGIQKNDERTATEALLQISKGDSGFSDTRKQKRTRKKSSQTKHGADKEKTTGKRVNMCLVCGKVGSAAMLTYHKYLHSNTKLTCEKCGQQFNHPDSLKCHMKQHGSKQFQCDQCPAAFHRKQYLNNHMLTHSGERPYICETCGKAYRCANDLHRHVRHIHEQQRNFECDICHDKFFRIDHMKSHRQRHFDANIHCPYCQKSFKLKESLTKHIKIHTGDKPFQCQVCKYGFSTSLPYFNHMRKKHNIDRDEARAQHNNWRQQIKNGDFPKIPKLVIKTLPHPNVSIAGRKHETNGKPVSKSKVKGKREKKRKPKKRGRRKSDPGMKTNNHQNVMSEDESDSDQDGLFLEHEEVEIGTSDMGFPSTGDYSKLCTSIDLDHSSYSGNIGSINSRSQDETFIRHGNFNESGDFNETIIERSESVGLLEFVNANQMDSTEQIDDSEAVVLEEGIPDLEILTQLEAGTTHTVVGSDYDYNNVVSVDQC